MCSLWIQYKISVEFSIMPMFFNQLQRFYALILSHLFPIKTLQWHFSDKLNYLNWYLLIKTAVFLYKIQRYSDVFVCPLVLVRTKPIVDSTEDVFSVSGCAPAVRMPSLSWPSKDKQHTGRSFFTLLWYTCSVALRRKSRLFVLLSPLSFHTAERDH